jgi:hypothetical protein
LTAHFLLQIYKKAVSFAIDTAQDLLLNVCSLVEVHDLTAANYYLTHFMGAAVIHDHIKTGIDIENSYSYLCDLMTASSAQEQGNHHKFSFGTF